MRVSVIVPALDVEPFLERAIASALAQGPVTQVLIVDDGSTDGTLSVAQRLAADHARVRVLRHPDGACRGVSASRNLGLAAAQEDWVAFLDADDFYLPERFAQAQVLAAADGIYEAVGTVFDSEAARERFLALRGHMLTESTLLTTVRAGLSGDALFRGLLWGDGGFCHLNGLTVRRQLALAVGGFKEGLPYHEDKLFLLKLASAGRLVAGSLERPVAMYRVHAGNRITRVGSRGSVPLQRAAARDLLEWGLASGMRPAPFREALKRYASWHAWRWRRLPSDHVLNRLLRRTGYLCHGAAHAVLRPRFSARVAARLLAGAGAAGSSVARRPAR